MLQIDIEIQKVPGTWSPRATCFISAEWFHEECKNDEIMNQASSSDDDWGWDEQVGYSD
jgi:hypothetical protein